ncbi:MAG: DUF4384 domain-containing protein [Treponema sp.]|jgi:hypothetical protein|nr:DUF4384 domain-containing protein [Treponema sp.]
MMKKNWFIVCGLTLVCASMNFGLSLDTLVERAVNNLVVARTTAITVRIEAITLRDSQTVSSLSGRLRDLVNYYAGKNGKYRVTVPPPETPPAKRGAPSVRPNNLDQGRINGSYSLLGNEVEVILALILDTNNQQIAIDKFSIPLAELERLGLKILPDNIETQEEALEWEALLTPTLVAQTPAPTPVAAEIPTTPTPVAQTPAAVINAFVLQVWADHDSRVYYDGEQMTIRLWADHDCYFIVYHIDVNQVRQVLFPNQYDRGSNFLKADTVKTIPAEGSRFDICEPFGEERILVIASDENFTIPPAERIPQTVSRGLIDASRDSVKRGVAVKPAALAAEAMFSFTVLPK